MADGNTPKKKDDSNVVPIKQGAPDENTPDPLLDVEYGIERILPFTAWGGAVGEIVRDSKISLDDLVDMRRRDGQARALMRLFVLPILSAMDNGEWVAPEGEDDEGAKNEVDYANNVWSLPPQAGGMKTSKTQFLKRTLQGLVDGFAVFEEIRTVPDDGELKGLISLSELGYRDPRTIRFKVDDHGKFDGIRQIASLNGKTIDVVIPKEKVWYWTHAPEENPYYGVSMFEAAYYHYEVKKKLYYIAHLASQFAAVPGRLGEVPTGADPRKVLAFKQSLVNFAFNTTAVFPEGYKVTPFNGNTGFDFIKLIDHHNHMMSKSVLAGFIDQENRSTLIEVGVTDPSTDFFVMALESIMDDIAESWTSDLMPKYIDWNFGTKKYPVFKFGQLSDDARTTIKDVFTAVVTSSVLNSTPEFVRELEKKLSKALDLPIDYDKIEQQEKDAATQEADAADQEAQQFGAPDPNAPAGPVTPPGLTEGIVPPAGTGPKNPVPPPKAKGSQGGTEVPAALSADLGFMNEFIEAAQELLAQRPEDL